MHTFRQVSFADLDADGRTEMLFVYRPLSESSSGNALYCFSDHGRELWRHQTARTVSTPSETYAPPFLAQLVLALPPGRDGRRNVLYVSHHLSYFPAQAVLLSPEGRVLGEYWHSGHLILAEAAQLEGLETPAILLAGISNSYRTTALIALDPDNMRCASDETEHPDYQLDPPGRDCELARILFPRTCINRTFEPYSHPNALVVQRDLIQIGTSEHDSRPGSNAVFYLDRQLALRSAEVIDQFLTYHRELEAARQLDHPFTEAELRTLQRVRILRHWKLAPVSSSPSGAPPRSAQR
jgi:hypothetical protein